LSLPAPSDRDDIDDDGLPFGQTREPRSFESADLDEHILSASLAGDEAEALFGVEPFYCPGLLDGYARRRPIGCRRPENLIAATSRLGRNSYSMGNLHHCTQFFGEFTNKTGL
jgi:hypothetical protein